MPISLTATAYTQNFDTLATSGTSSTLPANWLIAESGTNANATYTAGTGSSNAGDTYSFGAAGSSERALGGLLSGSLTPSFGASVVNDTGTTLTDLLVGYTGEQWRLGSTGRTDRLDFQYSLDATSLTTGTWLNVDALDFNGPISAGTVGALDGNAAANRTAISNTITGLSIPAGTTFWIRWSDFNATGADDGLAIDDLTLSAAGVPAVPTVTISATDPTASEAGSDPGTLRISRSGATTEALVVSYTLAGTASAADYTPALAGTATIAVGQSFVDLTITPVDDAFIEPTETLTLNLVDTAAYDLGASASATVSIADNDGAPTVNLSLSSSSASEAAATSITVTATVSSPVASNQSVTLAVSGSGITSSDYYLSATTITIPAGQTSGSVTFTVADDAKLEGAETATLTIGSPSAGITLGSTVSRTVAIADNAGSFLVKLGGATSTTASEIPAFDPASDRVYVVAASIVNVYQMAADGSLSALPSLAPGFAVPAGKVAAPNSVAIKGGIVAVAYEIKDATTNAHEPGRVSFFNAADGSFINAVTVGYLPDMLTFSPDGKKVLVANEGEPNSYGQATSFDPEGSVSIIDLSAGVAAATVANAGFASFNGQAASLKAAGVRIFGPGATVAQDLEPEYITITPDGSTAIVTLQEANAAAVIDIATATVTTIAPLGTKDFNLPGNGFDASDRDVNGTAAGGGKINIQNWPVKGMYQPDAIANFTVGGVTYYITANEGDSRAYTGFSEEVRVGDASYVLDPTAFPNAATLKLPANLGRLQLTNASGDTDGDGDFDVIMAFGGRSFTIWDPVGTPVYDSGDKLERITATRTPTVFNSDGTAASFDTRSDNKGPEPEGVVTGVIGGRTYAFVGLERVGDVMVFDVSNPRAPEFVQYINTPEDVAVEGLVFVSAADSPTGKPLLITAAEVSNTVAVFEIHVPTRIADIQGAAHISPLAGSGVQNVRGIVTAVASNGFYLQDPSPDSNPATSEGIFVFTNTAPTGRTVGEAVLVSGTVSEFRPGGSVDNLTTTEIVNNAAVQALVVSPWTDAPAGGITPIVLGVDRSAPTTVINNDFGPSGGNVETGGDFDPANEGIDFYESLEGMLVQVKNPVTVSPTSGFGEIFVLPNNGAGATGITERGGILVTASDFNPERLQLDNLLASQVFPTVEVGAKLNTVTGVIDYSFSNYELLTLATPVVERASTLAREVTPLVGTKTQLTVATFNVENLDPADGATKFNALASAIVGNLKAPDIINLEEVQDNNGPVNDSVVDANVTINTLIAAIAAAGGPTYEYRQINPLDDTNGGEPGGNIRVAYLFNPARVSFVDRPGGTATTANAVDGVAGDPQLRYSPGLIDPTNSAFNSSRKPLAGEFVFNGETVFIIGNHFNSKGGDDPLFGPHQPPVLSSEVQRQQQATLVKGFVDSLRASDPTAKVVVLGDLNDFEFSNPLATLKSAGLTDLLETLPANQRYTYNFEGNAQSLDHILVSRALLDAGAVVDVVHINSEFAVQVSDHDPLVARLTIEQAGLIINGTPGRDVLVGTEGTDTITGGAGRDLLTGGAASDKFVFTSVLDAGDQITDFQVGADLLVVKQLLDSVGYTGGDPVGEGYFGAISTATGTTITFDPDGAAGPGAARPLVDLVGVPIETLTPAILSF